MNCCENTKGKMTMLKVSGMTCAHFKKAIEKAIREIPGITSVSVDVTQGQVCIQYQGGLDLCCVEETIAELGYDVE